MNWNKGFSAQYYAAFIDPITWRDIERFEITGGTVKRSDSGLHCSADIDCLKYDQQSERWIRIWMNASQSGSFAHEAIFTGLATAPERSINGTLEENSLTCYSVLKSSEDILLPLGYYAPAGINGGQLVYQLLSESTPAPVTIVGDMPALSKYIVAEEGESYLSMAEKILSAVNGRLRVTGYGEIEISSMSMSISAKFDPLENDSIEPKLKATNDWYVCPNVFRAIIDDTSAVARDDSVSSPLSTVNRGREVWAEERDCDLNDSETLAEYAMRRLKEEQRHYFSVEYDRRFVPDLLPSDLVYLNYPSQGIAGSFYILDQSIKLEYGARTSEEVVQI